MSGYLRLTAGFVLELVTHEEARHLRYAYSLSMITDDLTGECLLADIPLGIAGVCA